MTTADQLSAQPFTFDEGLSKTDPQLFEMMGREFDRQQRQIELIASENIVSQAVLDAQGSVLTNKYAEGYPGRRYYGGCEFVDEVETLAIERAKRLFDCAEAIVQPHSGSQANQAVFMALLKPGEKILGLDLAAGGHLTHGAKVNQSGKWFEAVHYGVREDDHRIDMDNVREIALREKPQLIIAGGSAYSRIIDFKAFREIADEVGAYFLVDMAHFSGLVAGGHYPSPIPHAHAVTSTTHKTLRGPRGGIILTNEKDLAKKFRSALFPGLQGGPLMHVIAGKAAAFGEALTPEYKVYTRQVIENAKALASVLVDAGYAVVSGGTDTHVMLVDLRPKGVKGNAAEEALERAGMTCNKNGVPNDPEKPAITSGIRLGTPAATSRGFGVAEFQETGRLIARVLDGLAEGGDTTELENSVRAEVEALTGRFPIYGG
ncbi:serine hydroxymethyltransferase [Parvularcula sp. ZS-1/3]|uniref:Serine hydroxymethyltransferase n=1 Tax=Parvularcula mediterranea TaxID=2732508 RepID=A0A7Y3W5I8_9PROT|nr:serine hydroxymethyltransferase [Parvularcula mediterranea]NNU16326.1 serine hydroxymethyltransferase [Parvularcula mediterranea]